MQRVSFGIFDWMDDSERPLHTQYDERLRLAALADELGYDVYHVAEHHCTPLGLAPSPSLMLTAIARATTHMRLGPLVFLLPLYHPLRLVEEVCMLDHLSHGRLELGVGRGVSPWELGHYGVDVEDSRGIFQQSLKLLLDGLRGDGDGFGMIGNAPIEIRPLQQPYPPLWYASTSMDSVRWAAEQGLNLAGLGSATAWRERVDLYRETWAEHRDNPERLNAHVEQPLTSINRQIIVADSDEEAMVVARTAHTRWADNFIKLWLHHEDKTYTRRTSLETSLEEETLIVGSPETVRGAIGRLVETSGVDRVLGAFAWGSLTEEQTERSLRLFAEEVMPAFQADPVDAR